MGGCSVLSGPEQEGDMSLAFAELSLHVLSR